MRIEKKTRPEFFEQVVKGEKTFDLRLADWKCSPGDILVLKEWDSKANKYTGRVLEKKVTYVLRTKDLNFWTKDEIDKHGFQVIAFK